jgi:hypothetical protein
MSRDELDFFDLWVVRISCTALPRYDINSYQHSESKFRFLTWEGLYPYS